MKRIATVSLLLLLVVATRNGLATEEIALATGRDCGFCHLDPSGGGELTAAGAAYLIDTAAADEVATLSGPARIFRLVIGYLHIVFAVFWFGTILYVHIILKPAYAERGLPHGEKFLGILSFWVVGISGVILSYYRIGSWQTLLDSRFGVLLTIKVALYLVMLISAMLVIKVIAPRLARNVATEHRAGQPFTQKTLPAFNGKDGRPCYFAYQGKVYDAGASSMWPGGEHMRRHDSGQDLTEDLPMAPHDASVISRLSVVGDYVAAAEDSATVTSRIFYFVAYMNLGMVFLILFIIALWRWG